MEFTWIQPSQWPAVKEIYLEAFPKRERKPYGALKRSVQRGKATVLTAVEDGCLLGFAVLIPYQDMVMVDYLAVSSRIRSKGTGSQLLGEAGRRYAGKKIVLLIEAAENRAQRIARRSFYLKNGFASADLFIDGASGEMEIMTYGGAVDREAYLRLQKHALGPLFFRLSGIKVIEPEDA